MLNYHLRKQQGKSLYEQLYEHLRDDILNGKLVPGAKLPSKREMAESHGISVRTVMNAYEQLLAEGFIMSKEKKGYFVVEVYDKPKSDIFVYRKKNASFDTEKEQTVNPISLQKHKAYNQSRTGDERIVGERIDPEEDRLRMMEDKNLLVNFSSNHLAYNRFPISMWKKVMREVLTEYDTEIIERADCCGVMELRKAISGYLLRSRGMQVSPENIVIGSGVESLCVKLFKILPQDAVYGAETPGYRKIPWLFEESHLDWRSVGMNEEGINMKCIRDKEITVLHVSPEHHYPLGTSMTKKRKREILEWESEREDRYILEDDYDSEFRYHTQMNTTMYNLDTCNRVIYMNTFGKTLSPGIRINYMVLPDSLIDKYRESASKFANPVSSCEQYTLAKFINEGYFERHIRRMKQYCRESSSELLKLLNASEKLPIVKIKGGKSGTHLLIKLDTSFTDVEIKNRARALGVGISMLSQYCSRYDPKYEKTMVLTYSNVEFDKLEEAVHRLEKVFS